MVKIQIIQNDEELHSLSQDMGRLLLSEESKDTVVECYCDSENKDCHQTPLTVHSWIVRARSEKLAMRLERINDEKNKVSTGWNTFIKLKIQQTVFIYLFGFILTKIN